MDKQDIVEELDRLKLKIMLDDNTQSSDLERYEKWIRKLQGRESPYPWFVSNAKWSEYNSTRTLVQQLYHEKYCDKFEYQRDQPKIKRMIAEITSMCMFVTDKD